MEKLVIKDIAEIEKINGIIDNILKKSRVLCFNGDMGAGKTSIIKQICKYLEVEDYVTSPTFSIVNEYYSPKHGKIYHFDFYRINDISELHNIGIEEYFSENTIVFIEWPNLAMEILPENSYFINILNNPSGERIIEY
jgi:tRNA threonylcarbamoyladenosine biosynthesis protein TsaE